jgi:hypothetical protein
MGFPSNNTTTFNINNASMSDQSMYGALFTLNKEQRQNPGNTSSAAAVNNNYHGDDFKSGKNTRRTNLSGVPEMSFVNSPD